MTLDYLVEGVTDAAALTEIVEALARHYAPQSQPIEWGQKLTRGCHVFRSPAAGELVRAAGSERAVVLTDAWCDVAGAADFATTNTGRVEEIIRLSLERAGLSNFAIGVACAELETWLLLSGAAMRETGAAGPGIQLDAQGDCDDEAVDKDLVGKGRLEQLVKNYSAAVARKMARAMMNTTYSAESLMKKSQSFERFCASVVAMLGGHSPDLQAA